MQHAPTCRWCRFKGTGYEDGKLTRPIIICLEPIHNPMGSHGAEASVIHFNNRSQCTRYCPTSSTRLLQLLGLRPVVEIGQLNSRIQSIDLGLQTFREDLLRILRQKGL